MSEEISQLVSKRQEENVRWFLKDSSFKTRGGTTIQFARVTPKHLEEIHRRPDEDIRAYFTGYIKNEEWAKEAEERGEEAIRPAISIIDIQYEEIMLLETVRRGLCKDLWDKVWDNPYNPKTWELKDGGEVR